MQTRVVLMRHAESERSATGRHTGLTDMTLTVAGESQASRMPWLDATLGRAFAAGPASLAVSGGKGELPVVPRWNDSCHVEADRCGHALFP